MKKTYLLVLLFAISGVFAQESDTETRHIAEAEMKSASHLMNLVVNPNTLNYDITYHKLEWTVNPTVLSISGKVTTTYTALSNMTTLTFDLTNQLVVSSVKMGAASLTFVQNTNNELVITLPATQLSGTAATVEITYSGTPANSGFDSFMVSTHGSLPAKPILWTLSEPYGARDWWPCKQDLNDKVNSIDVYITAPSQYISVSNGIETTAPVIVGANKTTHFHHGYPIPAYLICMAVTNYQVYNQQGGLGTVASPFFPIINYIYPETNATMIPSLAVTPTIINFYETKFGDYPFRNEKYGHAQFGWGGGMEHTTVSFMTANGNVMSRSLIAHEMGHQWFGDKVTCGSWKDIWLNEGITEYLSGLVVENLDGAASFVSWKNAKSASITSQTNGNLYLTDAQATDVNRIFSSRLTYDKGSMVTNMIRFRMGDANFFQAMRNYISDPALAYGYALTPQFQAHLEAVSGLSFTEFFNDWVYNQGYPTYTITAQNINPGQVQFVVNQTQSDASVSFFEMPVPVRVFGSGGQQMDFILQNTANGQVFVENVPFAVTSVVFDPNKDIISKNNTATLGTAEYALAQAIQLYPNPATDVLHIEVPSSITLEKVTIYNSIGQAVLENNSNTISVASLATGVHFIEMTTSAGTFHKKFIKK